MKATTSVRTILAAAPAMLMAGQALAHTPYILPNAFDAERNRITLQGALTEDDYFNPDIALNVPAYVETLPSGQEVKVPPSAVLKDVTVTEAPLPDNGTYRFSTGQLVQRSNTLANINGKWLNVRQPRPQRAEGEGGAPAGRPQAGGGAPAGPPQAGGGGPPNSVAEADIPAGAQRMKTEGVMVVETYVSKGAPTTTALKTTGQGFELKPVTHPNAVYVDQGFAFQLLVDGVGAANAPISVYRSGNNYDDRRIAVEAKTDAKGMAKISFKQPGVYLLTTHYPAAERVPGEAPPAKTYTYSLTFEVTH